MSEKKFYVVYHDEYDYDLNYVADEKDNKLDAEDCCDLLNQLSEENERLLQQQHDLFIAETKIRSIKKENEKLRKEKMEANAFIVEKGLELEFIRWCKE